ncbi:hypothetical protein [Mycobacterium sp. 852002-51163_SCH5372311]|uniref:hypothetical protein n=1 Tax=Mycobacterium sp. 852002-51163_SCH5372311 TaxID=1834097 RepID=UPI0026F41F6F|nr:hypothetical protein [Mycobacterium sp. 852002-51163_SCH5372311]
MAAETHLGVDPDDLRKRLAELDDHVAGLLRARYGGSRSAYTDAWELWHRGAAEVQVGLSMLARLIAHHDYRDNDAAAAFRRHAERVVSEIDSLAMALQVPLPGRAAAAHIEAHRHWTRGEAMMRESLARLHDAGTAARTN